MSKLNLIIGPMFSGKSTTLLTRYRRYQIAGKKCLLIKYANDTRYSTKEIVTHDNLRYKATSCNKLAEVHDFVKDYDVICIDEIQFYEDASHYCDLWANSNKIVEVCGLNGDYLRNPFEQISLLIPLADDISFVTAVCKATGKDAPFTMRLTDESEQEVIGGDDIYQSVSREIYKKSNKEYNLYTIIGFDNNTKIKKPKKMKMILYKIEKWFNTYLGWFFINGRKHDDWTSSLKKKYQNK
jgi:thymidine kinase